MNFLIILNALTIQTYKEPSLILAPFVPDENVSGVHSFDSVTPHYVPPERRLDRPADLTDTQRGHAARAWGMTYVVVVVWT